MTSRHSSRSRFQIEGLELRLLMAAVPVFPDPNGLGSYASEPPAIATDANLRDFVVNRQYDWINKPAGAALPTNDWWTNILASPFSGNLWTYPLKVNTSQNGVGVSAFNGINASGGNITPSGEEAVTMMGQSGTFTRDALVNYGDWTVKFRMEQTASQYMDVTIGRGLPTAWFEFNGIAPRLSLGGNPPAYNATGGQLGNSFTLDRFRIQKGSRSFGVFAPAGTTFTLVNGGYNVTFASGAKQFLVVAALPDSSNATLDLFYKNSYAVPRNSTYGWNYNATNGAVSTTWTMTTELLKAGATDAVVQGWLPHNYRDIKGGPTLLANAQYATIQGPVKLSVGKSFTVVQPTNGVNFVLPAPKSIGGTSDYNAQQMATYLAGYNKNYKSASDTYWGGKTLQETAELTLMAQQLNDPNYARLLGNLKTAVTDWLTYSPGETAFFYAKYAKDKALVGFNPSFGSEKFVDHHFHYGYLTSAAGVLAMLDPAFADDYGAMAKLVAKEYANWDRADTSLPFLRTFEPWSGHSYAGGLGDGRGNNQESTSEAIQSWLGLVLLGQALNDPQMTAAGMMGYTIEAKAENEYWLDIAHNDLTPDSFGRPSVAINYDDARQYQTFFGLNPEYSLGILGLPLWPSMDFLGKHKTNMQGVIDAMFDYRKTFYNNPAAGTYASFETVGGGTDWFNVILGMQMQVNPQVAANEYARVWSAQTAAGKDPLTGLYYYQAQSMRTHGTRDWSYHLSLPASGVYTNAVTGKRTYVVYNPSTTQQTVQVLDANNIVIGTFAAAGRKVTVVEVPINANTGKISGTVFNDLDNDATRDANEPGIGSRTIYVDSDDDRIMDANEPRATSNGDGTFTITGLAASAKHVMRQLLPTGWAQTTPTGGLGVKVALAAGQSFIGALFGSRQTATRPPVRVNVGGGAFTTAGGVPFDADRGFTGGTSRDTAFAVAKTTDDSLFASRRFGKSFSYNLAAADGKYRLSLYFADPVNTQAGRRTFDVTVEGTKVLSNFDIVAYGGGMTAVVRTFDITVTGGQLNLAFTGLVGDAIVSAIELVAV